MSDTIIESVKKKPRVARKPRQTELDDFRSWLDNLGMPSTPKIHVNGPQYSTAVLVVDFGTPLDDRAKLSPDQAAEMIGHMRTATKAMFKEREVATRIQSDPSAGIWWSAIS